MPSRLLDQPVDTLLTLRDKQKVAVAISLLGGGVFGLIAYFRYQRKYQTMLTPNYDIDPSKKLGVDKKFLFQLKKLLPILFPSISNNN